MTRPGTARPRLTFVAHSYHQKTRSASFFTELLAEHFELLPLWDSSWQPGGQRPDLGEINRWQPDHLVFWQRLPPRRYLASLQCANQVWVPMHDDIDYDWPGHARLRGSGLKAICFSQEPRTLLESNGLPCLDLRYMPRPSARADALGTTDARIFFWVRRDELGWPTLKRLLGEQRPGRLVLRLSADPGHALVRPSEQDMHYYGIELVEGWLEQNDYQALMADCNVFIAPRLKEGIGIAALEAMARGMAVIAPDSPCLAEVIRQGGAGYLYPVDPAAQTPLDLSGLLEMRQRSLQFAIDTHSRWETGARQIVDFIRAAPPAPSWLWALHRAIRRVVSAP
jgi:hypothetical protein